MNDAIAKRTLTYWNKELDMPKMINKKVMRSILREEFSQVSDTSLDMMEVIVYSLTQHIMETAKGMHGDGRLTPEKIKDVLLKEDIMVFNYGNINVTNESKEVSENRIAQRVLSLLAQTAIKQVRGDDGPDYQQILEEELGE